jgi:hypothetical protein
MGSGCVPICRDCGGIDEYMTGVMDVNVISSLEDIHYIYQFVKSFLNNNVDKTLTEEVKKIFLEGLNFSQKNNPLFDLFIKDLKCC